VTLASATPRLTKRALTDGRGRFLFTDLPASSSYTISATKFGFLASSHAPEDAPPGTSQPMTLGDGQWIETANVFARRPGAIGGTVTDERGDPMVGITVRALTRVMVAGRSQFVSGPSVLTDDRGQYRLSGLTPGKYLIQVPTITSLVPNDTPPVPTPPGQAPVVAIDADAGRSRRLLGRYPLGAPLLDGHTGGYATTYYPETPASERSSTIALGFGEELDNVNIQLQAVRTGRVAGRIEAPPGSWSGLLLHLTPTGLESLGDAASIGTCVPNTDGTFLFENVPAGRYVISAARTSSQLSTSGVASSLAMRELGVSNVRVSARNLPVPGMDLSLVSYDLGSDESHAFAGRTPVTTNGDDLTGVVLTMHPLASISGRFVFTDGATASPFMFLQAEPASGDVTLGIPGGRMVDPQSDPGAFQVDGVLPGEYFLRTVGPTIKSITWNGRDYTDAPLDATSGDPIAGVVVTITGQQTTVHGHALAQTDGNTAPALAVIAFPTDPERWVNVGLTSPRLRSAAAASDGSYSIAKLQHREPAGRHLLPGRRADRRFVRLAGPDLPPASGLHRPTGNSGLGSDGFS
jgi:hypothetical protein